MQHAWQIYPGEDLLSNDETNNANEHNMDKNYNWREADQLVTHKHSRGVELGPTEKQLQLSVTLTQG